MEMRTKTLKRSRTNMKEHGKSIFRYLLCIVSVFIAVQGQATVANDDVFEEFATVYIEEQVGATLSQNTAIKMTNTVKDISSYCAQQYPLIQSQNDTYAFTKSLLECVFGDYYGWTIEQKHAFDCLMVQADIMPYCVNILPDTSEITMEDAKNIAFEAIADRYGVSLQSLQQAKINSVSYVIVEGDCRWRLGIWADEQKYGVAIQNAQIIELEIIRPLHSLEEEYTLLLEQRGGFFKWSLHEKMMFANHLKIELEKEIQEGAVLPSEDILRAISTYGFCLPPEECISQIEATNAATNAVASKYSLSLEWDNESEVYHSFFKQNSNYIWRIIFWKTGNRQFPSGIVEVDGVTGEILLVQPNGTTPNTFIPYVDRL